MLLLPHTLPLYYLSNYLLDKLIRRKIMGKEDQRRKGSSSKRRQ
jgi:hypothetical protein